MPSALICQAEWHGRRHVNDGMGAVVSVRCRAAGRTECQRSLRSNVNAQRESEPARRYSLMSFLMGAKALSLVIWFLRGDDHEHVKRADVLARAARQPSLGHVVLDWT